MKTTGVPIAVLGILFAAAIAAAQPAKVWRTGQTTCYEENGNVINCSGTGQDGDVQAGVGWPEPRFDDNGDGTVTDHLTGLIWLKNVSCFGVIHWADALTACNTLASGACGLADGSLAGDWRLPNRKELFSLIDFSRSYPALPQGHPFTNLTWTNSWSASTSAEDSSYAWYVNLDLGNIIAASKVWHGHGVWPVRGGQGGSFGDLAILKFGYIAEQQVGQAFFATITAFDTYGNLDAAFNGQVSLTSNLGSVKPTSVQLVNGQASVEVTVFNPGSVRLNCSSGGRYGSSGYFTVTGGGTAEGSVWGKVVDARGDPVWEAGVKLYDYLGQQVPGTHATDQGGRFSFTNLPFGDYKIGVEKNGAVKEIPWSLASSSGDQVPEIELPLNGGSDGTPVILVPGILGSSSATHTLSPYPKLSATCPDRHLHIHLPKFTGWKNLKDYLIDNGFNVFECPWDWRLPSDANFGHYLIPAIDEALQASITGKVHIVAHSMGGLIVRAYIQSSAYPDRNDIDKLVMVGTPHLGSSNPYYIWEGGDPKTVDDITDSGLTQFVNLYENTLKNLWEETYKKKGWDEDKHGEIRKFVRDKTKSLLQLMNTKDFLADANDSWGTSSDNENEWLKDLNSNPDIDRMSRDGRDGTVHVKIFATDDHQTIAQIKTLDRSSLWFSDDLYVDGRPKAPEKKNVVWGAGDGTVPYASAIWPYQAGWAELNDWSVHEAHGFMIKDCVEEIFDFLAGTEGTAAAMSTATLTAAAEPPVPEFTLAIIGDMRLQVTDPQGSRLGLDPATGAFLEEIPGAKFAFSGQGGSLAIPAPIDGTYTVTYFGAQQRDFQLDLGYVTEDASELHQYRGFAPGTSQSFQIALSASNAPHLTITPMVQAPTGLQANPYPAGGETRTRLSWGALGGAVSGYKLYIAGETDPYFTLLQTLPPEATGADTDLPWAEDQATAESFAVTALDASGAESFFSDLAQNNDRDHDGLTDAEETALGTNASNPDTDGDGLKDGYEDNIRTNPLVADTDSDDYTDQKEIQGGSDPLDAGSTPLTSCAYDANADGDVDGADLAQFITGAGGGLGAEELAAFALEYGGTECP